MPKGARVVDLAYKLNPMLGLQMVAARVDGKLFMPEDELVSGTQVEIVKAGRVISEPNRKYLQYCLPETEKGIRAQIMIAQRRKLVEKGRKLLKKIFTKFGLLTLTDLDRLTELKILTQFGCESMDQLFFKAGYAFGRYGEQVEQVMGDLKIGERKLTTVEIEGNEDRRGLSASLRKVIGEYGGNILHSVVRVEKDGSFWIRVMMNGVKEEDKKSIRRVLARYKVFRKVVVV